MINTLVITVTATVWPALVAPAAAGAPRQEGIDLSKQKTLYVTATAHLDTQWLWTIQDTIEQYIPATMRDNFALFEKYPDYHFSFEGAFRYMLMREYYPDDYARLKQYIAAGRWHVCGSFVDACDVNVPSPESLIRQILYGNGLFKREFGRQSCDVFLPDCFGFGWALPSVAAHCGLKGFSTQKLTWGSSVGIPFDLGVWEGVDGNSVIAVINPGAYDSGIESDLSKDPEWTETIDRLGKSSGVFAGYKYFGVGDRGGAPDADSVSWLMRSMKSDGPIHVVSAAADRIFHDLTPEQTQRLPHYRGEMLMTRHGVGCYTSQCAMKRWNRKNELLADASERAAVVAHWLGGAPYPTAQLRDAWMRFLWHQFHDDLTGTSIPQAYTFSWNDEIVTQNRFADVLSDSVGAVTRALDTQGSGMPVVVYNPLGLEREDVVEATVIFDGATPKAIRIFDPDGRETPSQVLAISDNRVKLLFIAQAPPVGFAVYDVRAADEPCDIDTGLSISDSGIGSAAYDVRIDDNGDIASIHDRNMDKELLAHPLRLQMLEDRPRTWPEWEIDYDDIMAAPRQNVGGPASIRIVERGPVRATLQISRRAGGSLFVQRASLSAMRDGGVTIDNHVDWRSHATLLKAAFPLTVSNPKATYDLGCGTIERGNNREQLYEVPAQQWADLTAQNGAYGATIASDCKYGWDKPDDDTLRLTLIHCPNRVEKDMGWHKFGYAIYGHKGDWRTGMAVERAARFNQPLRAFQAGKHDGPLGRRFSLLSVEGPAIVRAVKHAEEGDAIVVRIQEMHGEPAKAVTLKLAAPIREATELNGAEEPLNTLRAAGDHLQLDFAPYQLRTIALMLDAPASRLDAPSSRPIDLPFNVDVVGRQGQAHDGAVDEAGHSIPADLLPSEIQSSGVTFRLGSTEAGDKNAVACDGQTIALPQGDFSGLYLLAAATHGSSSAAFSVDGVSTKMTIGPCTGFVGQADSLIVGDRNAGSDAMAPAHILRDKIAWFGTHRLAADGRVEPYRFCCLFKYALDLPEGAKQLTLPKNKHIRVFAASVARNDNDAVQPAAPLYDDWQAARLSPDGGLFIDPVTVRMHTDVPGAEIVYTFDGTEPATQWKCYESPIGIDKDTFVRARLRINGRLNEYVNTAVFRFAEPRPADNPSEVAGGLNYRYYEGEWDVLPDFDKLEIRASGHTDRCDLSVRKRDQFYSVVFDGFVRVPRDGVYTFFLTTDDGSKLFIGDRDVVDNNGLHGRTEQSGSIALAAGLHALSIRYFQGPGDAALETAWEGPGLSRRSLSAGDLFRKRSPDESP